MYVWFVVPTILLLTTAYSYSYPLPLFFIPNNFGFWLVKMLLVNRYCGFYESMGPYDSVGLVIYVFFFIHSIYFYAHSFDSLLEVSIPRINLFHQIFSVHIHHLIFPLATANLFFFSIFLLLFHPINIGHHIFWKYVCPFCVKIISLITNIFLIIGECVLFSWTKIESSNSWIKNEISNHDTYIFYIYIYMCKFYTLSLQT